MAQNIDKISNFKLGKNQAMDLIICIAVTTFALCFLAVNLISNHHISTWQRAEQVTPQALLKQILSEKYTRHLDISSIQVMRVPSHTGEDLYIFDFHSPQLCGVSGCLYSVYNAKGNQLLEFIANPYLPQRENLIQISDTNKQEYPCLIITQNTATENIISRTQYCYQEGRYIQFNKILTKVGTNFKGEE
jgi:hypothetical protein